MSDTAARTAQRDALAGALARSTKELGDTERQLAEATRRARLPVLDNIRIASPCTMGWQNMTGDDRTRYCGQCKKDVYNLTSMTRAEAEALIIAKNGDLCARYFQRHDGTIMLADCDIGARRRRRMKFVAAGAAALLAGGAALGAMLLRDRDGRLADVVDVKHPQTELGGDIEGGISLERSDGVPAPELRPHSMLGETVDGGIGGGVVR